MTKSTTCLTADHTCAKPTEEVFVPQPGDIVVLRMDIVGSVAHLKDLARTEILKTVETDSYLAYVSKVRVSFFASPLATRCRADLYAS